MSLERDLEFLYEVGNLRFIPRQWSRFLNVDFANVAEHHYRVMWLALMIANYEKKADTGKIIKMALMHDITESRTGDVDYISRQYVKRDEELAINDMLQKTSLQKEFVELWQEYEERKSIESRIVKDADTLDVDMELAEQRARGIPLEKQWSKQRAHVRNTQLFTKGAKKISAAIKGSNPDDWHKNGRNRLNSGDWKR